MNIDERRIAELEEALRWLLVQVDDVKRTSVVRESFIYKHARVVLGDESPSPQLHERNEG